MATLLTFREKPCIRCHETFPVSNFYAHKRMADGLLNACKPCVKAGALQWGRDNKEARRAIRHAYVARNPAQAMVQRRALPQQAPLWYSELDELAWVEANDLTRLRSEATGIPHEIDHIVPLGGRLVSGLHWHANWRVVPAETNRRKWAHHDGN